MTRTLLLVALALLVATAMAGNVDMRARFEAFKAKHGKKYATAVEEAKRLGIFTQNMNKAAQLAEQNPKATFGENMFADMTPEEFKVYHNADNFFAKRQATQKYPAPFPKSYTDKAPQAFDWREHGAVTRVKHQGACGSCWAFSTIGNIEGQWFMAGHELVSISPQELTACDDTVMGCNGGETSAAFDWILQSRNGYISTNDAYPYVSGGGVSPSCNIPSNAAQVKIKNYYNIPQDEKSMAAYLAEHGPTSICVDASTWHTYTGGVMTNCPSYGVDHCVLLVGYNLTAPTPYWIIKNSWHTSWGLEGYMHVQFGTNQCDLASSPRNAIIDSVGPTKLPLPTAPRTSKPVVVPEPGSFNQYTCESQRCDGNCTLHTFKQSTCVALTGKHQGMSIRLECQFNDGDSFVKSKVFESTDCSGFDVSNGLQSLGQCDFNGESAYVYNVCPKFNATGAPQAAPVAQASLPPVVQKHMTALAKRALAKRA